MHELGLVLEILEVVSERAGARRIERVVVEVGEDAAIFSEALQFAWEVAAPEYGLNGARLEIVRAGGQALRIREMEVTS
jgi:Zn finger protein HypA/HybF involved in hydrogenase expression